VLQDYSSEQLDGVIDQNVANKRFIPNAVIADALKNYDPRTMPLGPLAHVIAQACDRAIEAGEAEAATLYQQWNGVLNATEQSSGLSKQGTLALRLVAASILGRKDIIDAVKANPPADSGVMVMTLGDFSNNVSRNLQLISAR
jgi:hypothetical protein